MGEPEPETETTLKQMHTRKLTVYFVRHGVAIHNIPVIDPTTGVASHPNLQDPSFTDSRLIPRGERQAWEAGHKLFCDLNRQDGNREMTSVDDMSSSTDVVENLDGISRGYNYSIRLKENENYSSNNRGGKGIDMVVTSPLTRCIHTASLAMQSYLQSAGGSNVIVKNHPLFVCQENLREAHGRHFSDKRRKKSELEAYFPMVQFDPEMKEDDVEWNPNERETVAALNRRIDQFMYWLACRDLGPSPHVLIASHGVWIECCLLRYFPQVLDMGRKRVNNCDLFCGTFSSIWEKSFENQSQVSQSKSTSNPKWSCSSISLENVRLV
mmetsp:Transcript_7184/g.10292  ORF Transcript_7184/g.10292 Transcript_7184/m.10292 type:complete len:325 (-) Transcript_7184:261-1235(-)|eukprot:CAMPEP_0184862520 /NCGR_PEP_ID=MMETSP0580-20130426/6986_1 /TAXON_ID=1118495 /ORGANISM="Dactyliosolen fragilissimus" /LENGTH=324 /DNA_ID=CAMNT_0027360439 /DNA_START=30 /DNA_END=1004 /DNA_ORIENTATION=-